MAELAALQRAFHAAVTRGESAPDLGCDPARLAVYAEGYAVRLHDALAADCPKLRDALGPAWFAELAAAYVAACPPRGFSLREASDRFAGFLAGRDELPGWCAELAALERARVEVFDAADDEPLTRAAIAALAAADPAAFADLGVRWVTACIAVPLAWSVAALWSAIEDASDDAHDHDHDHAPTHAAPAPIEPSIAVIWRSDLRVLHRMLEPDEAAIAPLLARGATLAEIAEALAAHAPAPDLRMSALLAGWLDAGLVARVEPTRNQRGETDDAG